MACRNFVDSYDYTPQEFECLLDLASALKRTISNGYYPELLKHKTLGMIFEQVSTRTRIASESAITELGGHAQFFAPGSIQLGGHESLEDTAHVLGLMLDALVVRAGSHKNVCTLARLSQAPVINALTDYNHPTQELVCALTILEHLPQGKSLKDVKIAFVGDATQMCVTALFMAAHLGMDFVHYGPVGHLLTDGGLAPKESPDFMARARELAEKTGAIITVTSDRSALQGADFIYTDVWYGLYGEELSRESYWDIFYPDFQVTREMLKFAGPTCKFIHCLPASREEEVTSDVLDDPELSLAWDMVVNCKPAMQAALIACLPVNKLNDEAIDYVGKAELHQALEAWERLR